VAAGANFTCTAPPPPTRPETPRLAIGADEHRAAFAAASTGFEPLARFKSRRQRVVSDPAPDRDAATVAVDVAEQGRHRPVDEGIVSFADRRG